VKMRIVKVKESGFKSKRVKGKVYVWRQKWLNVPAEYKNYPYLLVMGTDEFIEILWNDEAREKAREEYSKEFERYKTESEKKEEREARGSC